MDKDEAIANQNPNRNSSVSTSSIRTAGTKGNMMDFSCTWKENKKNPSDTTNILSRVCRSVRSWNCFTHAGAMETHVISRASRASCWCERNVFHFNSTFELHQKLAT